MKKPLFILNEEQEIDKSRVISSMNDHLKSIGLGKVFKVKDVEQTTFKGEWPTFKVILTSKIKGLSTIETTGKYGFNYGPLIVIPRIETYSGHINTG